METKKALPFPAVAPFILHVLNNSVKIHISSAVINLMITAILFILTHNEENAMTTDTVKLHAIHEVVSACLQSGDDFDVFREKLSLQLDAISAGHQAHPIGDETTGQEALPQNPATAN